MAGQKWIMTNNGLSLFIKTDSLIIEEDILPKEIDSAKTQTNVII